eukprot:gene2270-13184_t
MWNPNEGSGACETTCDRLTDDKSCLQSRDMCEWKDGSCKKKCYYRHNYNTTCNPDGDCVWDVENGVCAKKCSDLNSLTTCSANPMCQFKANECVTKCIYKHSTSTACNSDKSCEWDQYKGKCINTCQPYKTFPQPAKSCEDDSMCELIPSQTGDITKDSKKYNCEKKCTIKYSDKEKCVKDDNCMWDANNGGQCVTSCLKRETDT